LWKTCVPATIKSREVEAEDLSAVYQKIVGGVNITLLDIRKYLHACTGMFSQVVDEDLEVSPR